MDNVIYSGNTHSGSYRAIGNATGNYNDMNDGSSETPYRLYTSSDLLLMRNRLNADPYADGSGHYVLEDDIDLSSVTEWYLGYFSGYFDGQGHTIDVSIYVSGDAGLFSTINNVSTGTFGVNWGIENLNVRGSVKGTRAAGIAVVGRARNCSFTGTVEARSDSADVEAVAGGIIAVSSWVPAAIGADPYTIVSGCVFSGTVTAENTVAYGALAGGILGELTKSGTSLAGNGEIYYCDVKEGSVVSAIGATTSDDMPSAGGIVGAFDNVRLMYFHYNNSDAQVTASKYAGGFIGYLNPSIASDPDTFYLAHSNGTDASGNGGYASKVGNTFTHAEREIGNFTKYFEQSSGDSWENAWEINTSKDFLLMHNRLAGGDEPSGKYYKLTSDIEMTGNWSTWGYESNFYGHLDGQGYTITLSQDDYNEQRTGLFANLSSDVKTDVILRNLNVSGSVNGLNGVGGIAYSLSSGVIEHCSFTGLVNDKYGRPVAGGIVAYLYED